MKKPHSNVAHNRPPTFFNVLAWLPKQPRNRNPVPRKAPYCRTGNLDWKSNFILESFIFIDFFFIPFHFFTILGITILQCSIAHEIQLPFNSAFRLTYASKAHAANSEGATNFSQGATCFLHAHVLLVSLFSCFTGCIILLCTNLD